MPYIIQPPPHHQPAAGVSHDLAHLFALLPCVTVDAAVLAAGLLRFQRTFDPFADGVLHESGTFAAEVTLPQTSRQNKGRTLRRAVPSIAVDLDKLADQPDIFFLVLRKRFHDCDNAPFFPNQT